MFSRVRNLFLLLSFFLLGSCSQLKFAYNSADWFLKSKIENYTDFSRDQKNQISEEVDKFHSWHRANILSQYVAFLKKVKERTGGSLTAKAVSELHTEMRALYSKSIEPVVVPMVQVLLSLSDSQIDKLERNFSKAMEKVKKDTLGSSEEQEKKRFKRTLKFYERFDVDFTDDQEDQVREIMKSVPLVTSAWVEAREAKQIQLVKILRDKNKRSEQLEPFVRKWITDPQVHRATLSSEVLTAWEAATNQSIASVVGLLSEKQKARFHKKIDSMIEDFEELIADD